MKQPKREARLEARRKTFDDMKVDARMRAHFTKRPGSPKK